VPEWKIVSWYDWVLGVPQSNWFGIIVHSGFGLL
jgi:hypothetical protein